MLTELALLRKWAKWEKTRVCLTAGHPPFVLTVFYHCLGMANFTFDELVEFLLLLWVQVQ